MKYVATKNELTFGSDVRKIAAGSPDHLLNFFEVNPNTTRYMVVWCTDSWMVYKPKNISIPCTFEHSENEMIFYTIWTNKSLTPEVFMQPVSMPNIKD